MIASWFIRPSVFRDVKELSNSLRPKDIAELIKMGIDPYVGLRLSYKHALFRKTIFVNDKIAGMWGVVGSVLSEIGHPYFLTGTAINDLSPITFARIYKQEVEQMKIFFPRLENVVDSDYTESVRLLKISGFTLDPPDDSGFQRFHLGFE